MADLIDRDALMKEICDNECGSVCDEECENALCNFYDYIMDAPTIEAELVKRGEWHECWYTDTVCASICTHCGKAATQARVKIGQELSKNVRYPICPNCGAKMDLRINEEDSMMMGGVENG